MTCTLGYNPTAGQDDFDSSTTNEGTYVFDELGLSQLCNRPADSKLLTHVIFHLFKKVQTEQLK